MAPPRRPRHHALVTLRRCGAQHLGIVVVVSEGDGMRAAKALACAQPSECGTLVDAGCEELHMHLGRDHVRQPTERPARTHRAQTMAGRQGSRLVGGTVRGTLGGTVGGDGVVMVTRCKSTCAPSPRSRRVSA